jgi:hypothetical protein
MATLIKKVFRCRHDHGATSLTYGPGQRPPAAFYTAHKIICLDCGKELPFGWHDVDIISPEVPNYEAMAVFASSVAES